jgi:hypothetical protein
MFKDLSTAGAAAMRTRYTNPHICFEWLNRLTILEGNETIERRLFNDQDCIGKYCWHGCNSECSGCVNGIVRGGLLTVVSVKEMHLGRSVNALTGRPLYFVMVLLMMPYERIVYYIVSLLRWSWEDAKIPLFGLSWDGDRLSIEKLRQPRSWSC